MQPQATKDEAAEFLRLSLPLMAKYAIPVTPANYAVWFEYAAGTNEPLRESLDDLIGRDQPVDEGVTQDHYHRYVISNLEKRLAKTRAALRVLLDDMGESVTGADQEISKYQESLVGYSNKLSGEMSTRDLQDVLSKLSAETNAVRETGYQLHEKLEASRLEAEALRKELEQARHEASTDALTGLANRKALFRTLDQLTTADGGSGNLCLLLGDIDHFKKINDAYGHLLGDKVIRFIGSIMKNCVKGKDLVARFGGEEFAIVLPETSYEGALAVAENIRASIENGRLVRSDTREPIGTVTVSIGVSVFRPEDEHDDLIARADEGLYKSKQTGRNKITGERQLIAAAS